MIQGIEPLEGGALRLRFGISTFKLYEKYMPRALVPGNLYEIAFVLCIFVCGPRQ